MREYKKYSKEECLFYWEEYLSFSFTKRQFERDKGLKRTTIQHWLGIFGLEDKPDPFMSKKLIIFVAELVSILYSKHGIKRESGVNPEQSCCCEPPFNFSETSIATDVVTLGRLRKGRKSEDLPQS